MAINARFRFLAIAVAFFLTLSIFTTCDMSFFYSGLPGYYTFVQSSVNLEQYGLEGGKDSNFRLQTINKDLFPGVSDTRDWVALRWQNNHYSSPHLLLFDSNLNLQLTDDDVEGDIDYWIYDNQADWVYRLDGMLDFGKSRFDPLANPPEHYSGSLTGTARDDDKQQWAPLAIATSTGKLFELASGSTDIILNYIRYWNGSSDADNVGTGTLTLLSSVDVTVPTALKTAGYQWHFGETNAVLDGGGAVTSSDFYTDNAELLGIYSLDDTNNLGIAFFYKRINENYASPAVIIAIAMTDELDGVFLPTSYTVIPTVHVDRPFLLFDGEYLVTINMPKNYRRGQEESEDDMIDQLQLTSWKMNAIDGTFTADAFYSWRSLFGSDTHPNRDIQLDLLSASGKWYLFDRTSLSLYKLSLGEGGW